MEVEDMVVTLESHLPQAWKPTKAINTPRVVVSIGEVFLQLLVHLNPPSADVNVGKAEGRKQHCKLYQLFLFGPR
jgi:hypothetical protein